MSGSPGLSELITGKLSCVASEILAAVEEALSAYRAEVSSLRQEVQLQRSRLKQLEPRVKEEPADHDAPRDPSVPSSRGGHEEDRDLSQQESDVSPRSFPSAVSTDAGVSIENYVDLKICILTDGTIEAVSDQAHEEYPVHELPCRSGLQEADFLLLLRSSFPQLAPSSPLEFFIADGDGTLQPLKVSSFTPEQICGVAGNSALYLRLKSPIERTADGRQHTQVPESDEDASSVSRNEPRPRRRRRRQKPIELKVRLLENPDVRSLSMKVLQKYKLKMLRCPRGMSEADFLELLRSSFPQLTPDRSFEYLMTNTTKSLFPLEAESFTPEGLLAAAGNSGIYVRLKPVEGVVPHARHQNQTNTQTDGSGSASTQKEARKEHEELQLRATNTDINLRIHLLEDPGIHAITPGVLRKYPLNKMWCPRGLTEEKFLHLLRSTFPTLTQFDSFRSDCSGNLWPLKVTSFVPELILTETKRSALFIRVKHSEEPKDKTEDLPQKSQSGELSVPHPDATTTKNESQSIRNEASGEDTHIDLYICCLDDSKVDVNSLFSQNPQLFFKKYPVQMLKCPRGLQETDFLAFLKHRFPHLADGLLLQAFALHGKRMVNLKLSRVTPDEILRTTKSIGSSVVCVQQLKQKQEAAEAEVPPTTTQQTSSCHRVESPGWNSPGPPNSELENLVDLKICIVDDPSLDVTSPLVLQKYPILELQCPGSLKEAEFLDLLRSTFPQLAGEALDLLASHGSSVMPIDLESLESDQICRNLQLVGSSLLYIRLKEQRNAATKRSLSAASDQSTPSPRKRIKRLKKRSEVQPVQSALQRREEEEEEEEEEESDNDETEDSEDEHYRQHPPPSRLASRPLLEVSRPSSERNAGSAHTTAEKKKHSSKKPSSLAEDEVTEDSEDYSDYEGGPKTSSEESRRPGKTTRGEIEEVEIVDSEDDKPPPTQRSGQGAKRSAVRTAVRHGPNTNDPMEVVEVIHIEDDYGEPPVASSVLKTNTDVTGANRAAAKTNTAALEVDHGDEGKEAQQE